MSADEQFFRSAIRHALGKIAVEASQWPPSSTGNAIINEAVADAADALESLGELAGDTE